MKKFLFTLRLIVSILTTISGGCQIDATWTRAGESLTVHTHTQEATNARS